MIKTIGQKRYQLHDDRSFSVWKNLPPGMQKKCGRVKEKNRRVGQALAGHRKGIDVGNRGRNQHRDLGATDRVNTVSSITIGTSIVRRLFGYTLHTYAERISTSKFVPFFFLFYFFFQRMVAAAARPTSLFSLTLLKGEQ